MSHRSSGRTSAVVLAIFFFSGVSGLVYQVVWVRQFGNIFGNTVYSASLVTGVFMAGLGAGAYVLGRAGDRAFRSDPRSPLRMYAGAELAIALLGLSLALLLPRLGPLSVAASSYVRDTRGWYVLSAGSKALRYVAAVGLIAPATFLMGGTLTLLVRALVTTGLDDATRRIGHLYGVNTAGAAVGALLTDMALVPALGIFRAQVVAVSINVAAGTCALLLARASPAVCERPAAPQESLRSVGAPRRGIELPATAVALALTGFAAMGLEILWFRFVSCVFPLGESRAVFSLLLAVILTGIGIGAVGGSWVHRRFGRPALLLLAAECLLAVTKVPGFFLELLTNGHGMSSTHPKAQRYMRAFAHVPLLQMDDPKSALVICFGVGVTTNAASLHTGLTRLDVADLSRNILEHARWFDGSNHDVLADPRVSVFVNDGRHHLLMQPEGTYDLITLEPPPIAHAGVASLYSREFYKLAKSRLVPGGFMTQWLPAYQVPDERVRSAVRAFIDVFPESVLLSGDDNELILMGTRGPSIRMDIDAVARRLRSAPRVQADLDHVHLGDLTELAGMFAASHATMVRATRDVAPVTDDRPSLEYSLRSGLPDLRMPADLFDVTGIDAWCPDCIPKLPRLAGYLRLRGAVYASDFFLATRWTGTAPFDLASVPDGEAIVASSSYLQILLGGPAAPAKQVALESFREGRLTDAEEGLETARVLDPHDPDTYEQLARVFTAMAKPDVAARALAMAREVRSRRGSTVPAPQ